MTIGAGSKILQHLYSKQMSEVRLSGKFQPSVFFNFGEGEVFSNKFAESLRPFSLHTAEGMNGDGKRSFENVYQYDYNNHNYIKTDRKCPRCALEIGGNESNNIKVDLLKLSYVSDGELVKIEDRGIYWDSYGWVGNEEDSKCAYKPSIIAMPQYAPIVRDGIIYDADYARYSDGEVFTIVVEPNNPMSHFLSNPRRTSSDYISALIRRSSIILFADKRRLKTESYDEDGYYAPDSYETEGRYKFKIGDSLCDCLCLGVGSMVKLRTVVDTIDDEDYVYWEVENHHSFHENNRFFLNLLCYKIEEDGFGMFNDGVISTFVSSNINETINNHFGVGDEVELAYIVSTDTRKDWRDRIIDDYVSNDIEKTGII